MKIMDRFKFCPVCGSGNFSKKTGNSIECGDCRFEYFINASACASVIIINREGRVLLSKRKNEPQKGLWDFPGGFISPGETAEEACGRELSEELGVALDGFIYFLSHKNDYLYKGTNIPLLDFYYLHYLKNDVEFIPNDDVEEVQYVDPFTVDMNILAYESVKDAVIQLQNIMR